MFGLFHALFVGGAHVVKGIQNTIENEEFKQKYRHDDAGTYYVASEYLEKIANVSPDTPDIPQEPETPAITYTKYKSYLLAFLILISCSFKVFIIVYFIYSSSPL